MPPDRVVEILMGALVVLGGTAVWAFGVESRLRVVERLFEKDAADKAQALRDLKVDMHEIKATLETLSRRCVAFRHFERATFAGQEADAEP